MDAKTSTKFSGVTAYRGRREELLAEGFVELLEKPLDPMTLCGVVRRYAQR